MIGHPAEPELENAFHMYCISYATHSPLPFLSSVDVSIRKEAILLIPVLFVCSQMFAVS